MTNVALKVKLVEIWKLNNFKLIPLHGGIFHIRLSIAEDQSLVISHGSVNVNTGVIRISRWML